MNEFRADLHCHSTYSDGLLTPIELLQLAKLKDLSGLSITDHDTIAAYSQEVYKEAKRLQIELLCGVEISSQYEDTSVHILGYGFDLSSSFLKKTLKEIRLRRMKRNRKILEKLAKHHMPIEEEELIALAKKTDTQTIGRPHIARIMLEKRYVSSFQQAFNLYLKDGGKCYVAADKFSCKEIITIIHEVKGKAIIAHPHQITETSILSALFSLPFDGLEGYYSHMPLSQERKWIDMAKEKKWIVTGGSDFHGKENGVMLGSSWVGEEVFKQLQ